MCWAASQSRTSPPIWLANPLGSKSATRRMPDLPATRLAQNASTLWPSDVTTPRPVTTTRRAEEGESIRESANFRNQENVPPGISFSEMAERPLPDPCSAPARLGLDVLDHLADRLQLFGV